MAETKGKRKRIELLDVAKAITIFLVIVGHTTANTDTVMYRRVLYSFHMPLFFFLAGMSTRPQAIHGFEAWRDFLRKNMLALIAPYTIWALVYGPFSFASMPDIAYGSWESLTAAGTLTSLWYLTSFFVARVMVQLVMSTLDVSRLKDNPLPLAPCSIPFFLIGFALPHPQQGFPWCLDVSFVAAGFILLGISLRIFVLALAVQHQGVLLATFLGSVAGLAAGTVGRGDACELVLMCGAQYGNLLWFFLNVLFGTMAVLSLSMILIRSSHEGPLPYDLFHVSFIGMHTMGIFLLHKPFLQEVIMPYCTNLMPDNQLICAIVASVFSLISSMILCVIIEHYIPELLGQFPVYPTTIAEEVSKKHAEAKPLQGSEPPEQPK